ncbi:hypothetical protein AAAX77_01550 [Collinsella sp. CLA-ER-H6]|uniref:hypothetical protein n=1 Tax=Collinsella sp. CLA-ER-H6 TaxID=3136231 RepID=UPI0032BF6FC7
MNSKNVFLTNSFYKEHPNHLVCSLYSDINTKEVDVFWSYVQLDDGTQFAYSETRDDGTVRVAVERPVDLGFDHAECFLPAVNWFNVEGFSIDDLDFLPSSLDQTPHLSSSLQNGKKPDRRFRRWPPDVYC